MQKAVIFGAGIRGIEAQNILSEQYHIQFFVDNDITKWNTVMRGGKQ